MWCRIKIEISWTDRVRNEGIWNGVNKERNTLYSIKRRKANWTGHILRRNCHLKDVVEEKLEERRRGRRRSKQLLDGVKEKSRYLNFEEEELVRTRWMTGFGRGNGSVFKRTTQWKKDFLLFPQSVESLNKGLFGKWACFSYRCKRSYSFDSSSMMNISIWLNTELTNSGIIFFWKKKQPVADYNQQDAPFLDLFISTDARHVSGGSSAHRQEHITVHTASGIVNQYCCLLLSWMRWNAVPSHPW